MKGYVAVYSRYRALYAEEMDSYEAAVDYLQWGMEWGELFAHGIYDREAGAVYLTEVSLSADSRKLEQVMRAVGLDTPLAIAGHFPAFPNNEEE